MSTLEQRRAEHEPKPKYTLLVHSKKKVRRLAKRHDKTMKQQSRLAAFEARKNDLVAATKVFSASHDDKAPLFVDTITDREACLLLVERNKPQMQHVETKNDDLLTSPFAKDDEAGTSFMASCIQTVGQLKTVCGRVNIDLTALEIV